MVYLCSYVTRENITELHLEIKNRSQALGNSEVGTKDINNKLANVITESAEISGKEKENSCKKIKD